MHAIVLNTTNSLENLPKTCEAKFIPYKVHPTAYNKYYGYKQSPQWHSLICIQSMQVINTKLQLFKEYKYSKLCHIFSTSFLPP